MAINILVSACLLGINCRYDGISKGNKNVLKLLQYEDINLIPICPEQLGGFPTPRIPSEIQGRQVINKSGIDVTDNYKRGAEAALHTARLYKAFFALLKEKSPSCGHGEIYDGSFSKTLIDGNGITAELLEANGIHVYGESEIDSLLMDVEDELSLYPVDDEFLIAEILDDREEFYWNPFDDELDFEEEYSAQNRQAGKIKKVGKNHIKVNGQILQTNKKYSALKNSQKQKIASWMREEIRSFYDRTGKYPYKGYNSQIVEAVYAKIQEAQIWIPYGEVAQEFERKKHRMIKSVKSALEKETEAKEQE